MGKGAEGNPSPKSIGRLGKRAAKGKRAEANRGRDRASPEILLCMIQECKLGSSHRKKKAHPQRSRLSLPLLSARENKDRQHCPNHPLHFAEDEFPTCPRTPPRDATTTGLTVPKSPEAPPAAVPPHQPCHELAVLQTSFGGHSFGHYVVRRKCLGIWLLPSVSPSPSALKKQ